MELEYDFLPQDFNEQNKGFVVKMLDTYQKQFESELRRPDHPHKEVRFKTIRHNIDKLQWYLDHYDAIMEEKTSGPIRYLPFTSFPFRISMAGHRWPRKAKWAEGVDFLCKRQS